MFIDPEPVLVKSSDYWKFHEIMDEGNKALSENYRPVQSLNGRQIKVFHKAYSRNSWMNSGILP
jgi:hypothetical protein